MNRSRKEAAQRLGISVKKLMREVDQGKIGCIRLGRRVLFTDEQIDAYNEAHTIDPAAAV